MKLARNDNFDHKRQEKVVPGLDRRRWCRYSSIIAYVGSYGFELLRTQDKFKALG